MRQLVLLTLILWLLAGLGLGFLIHYYSLFDDYVQVGRLPFLAEIQ
jgi:hypothetical protein